MVKIRQNFHHKNMKKSLLILSVILLLFLARGEASAYEQASGSSASLNSFVAENEIDNREKVLRDYLISRNSPLAPHAGTFIATADKYNLDWRLVVSISGLESGFGKHQPTGSHNGWGWGYSNGTVKHFHSWDEAIEEISYGLRHRYLKEIPYSDPYIIGPTYAASPTWAVRVTNFMNQIEIYRQNNAKSALALAL
jgi:hypothetical protein